VKRWIAISGAAVAVAIALVIVGVGGSGGRTVPPSTVTQAAAATAATRGYRIAVDGVVTVAGQRIAMKGAGAVDTARRRGSVTYRITGMPGAAAGSRPIRMEQVFEGAVMYMRSPLFAPATGGRDWIKFDTQRIQRAAGTALPGNDIYSDPSQMVDQLRAISGDVEEVGRETVRGARTTHYRGTVDLRRYPKLAPPARRAEARAAVERLIDLSGTSKIPQEIWIDARLDHRRVRRHVEMKLAAVPGEPTMKMDLTQDLFAFGAPVDVRIPSDDDVKDVTELGVNATPGAG
jgi:hypothetical protein